MCDNTTHSADGVREESSGGTSGKSADGGTREITIEVDEWEAQELAAIAGRYDEQPTTLIKRCSRYILEEERRG